jgi:DNA-binding CsgD family transcriptional regulator/tetratricopeptide (TPR) repeat protein
MGSKVLVERRTALLGRRRERRVLNRLLEGAQAARSGALVMRGEPGVGKSALLEYALDSAPDFQVLRALGVESEMELPFAALHQLCGPVLDRLELLPGPQRDALATTFGLRAGAVPDRLLVGLAVLTLLAEVAGERPLLCVVDDAQWLDRASAQVLGFVARRLFAESVVMLFAAREPGNELQGLDELVVEGLGDADAGELLASVIRWPLDDRVRRQIVEETRGNPLALLELPMGLSPAQLAGGFGLPGALTLSGRLEENFLTRLEDLPADTQRLLLVASADPAGDPALVWRAARVLGIDREAAMPAQSAGLVQIESAVRFRHPLVRSAIYRAATTKDRQAVHGALAEATDPDIDPDRRAWHRAHATTDPDEDVALELERSAGRAQRRGGMAAAAAFLERAAQLTPDEARRAQRELDAAQAMLHAGAFESAQERLAAARAGPLDEVGRARVELLLGRIAWSVDHGSEAPPLILSAAKRLEPLDLRLARETYLDAFVAATTADRLTTGGDALEVAKAVRAGSPPPQPLGAVDQLLDGLALLVTGGHAVAKRPLQPALDAFVADELARETTLRWILLSSHTALLMWDHKSWQAICARQLGLIRHAGALSMLPYALIAGIFAHLTAGELAQATSLVEELGTVAEATRSSTPPQGAIALAALQGREAETLHLVDASMPELVKRGEGMGVTMAQWALAVLYNGLGRYKEAAAPAKQALADEQPLGMGGWARIELIEAAVRSGNVELAAEAVEGFSARTSGTDWALGVDARSRALVSQGDAAETAYRDAIERLDRTGTAALAARTRLVYGEWLRGEQRCGDAREQLREAFDMLVGMGMEAFARRAERELIATGSRVRKRSVETLDELTPREARIARLARDGLSNPEIGARLFISPRTVEYHLRKVFAKLNISSRSQLQAALPEQPLPTWA